MILYRVILEGLLLRTSTDYSILHLLPRSISASSAGACSEAEKTSPRRRRMVAKDWGLAMAGYWIQSEPTKTSM